ncbi:MAG: hypothetical protein D3910_25610 [Candidatus Electrothrix sp. ATG2]|nr:hypothetical protein [Candidatus Electrothrix sp. ATG2]
MRCWNFAEDNSCREELPGAVRKQSLEELYPWFPYYIKAFGGTRAWCSWSTRSPPFKTFLQEIINVARAVEKGNQLPWNTEIITECRDNARSTFIEYIFPFIEKHPDTKFFFFFPPYSRLWYSIQEQYYTGYYQSYLFFIEDVVRTVSSYSNVRVFGFDDMEFTGDIANYKDQSHYHKDINSKLLELMAATEGVLTEDNIDDYLERISTAAHDYNLNSIAEEFKTCLQRQ